MIERPQQERFKNKYRISSARLKNWNYSKDGSYFITICTQYRQEFFGYIKNEKISLTKIGKIAKKCWQQIPDHFPNVILDEWVIMPNHIHGIITLHNNSVETLHATSLQNHATSQRMSKISPKPHSIATIIRSYKSTVSKLSRKNHPHFSWQPRYWDRIIRNEQELERIQKYIFENPQKWQQDHNNTNKHS